MIRLPLSAVGSQCQRKLFYIYNRCLSTSQCCEIMKGSRFESINKMIESSKYSLTPRRNSSTVKSVTCNFGNADKKKPEDTSCEKEPTKSVTCTGASKADSAAKCGQPDVKSDDKKPGDPVNRHIKITCLKKVNVEDCPMPELPKDHVMIQTHSTGLTGADILHFTKGTGENAILGQEASGIVYDVGCEVKHLKKGDQVVIEPGIPCGRCRLCRLGRYNVCESMQYSGLLAAYLSHRADLVYKVPKSLDLELSSFTDTMAQALQSCCVANVGLGSSLLILGACSRGLATIVAARSLGADTITIADTEEKNLQVARKICADSTINIADTCSCDELVQKVLCELKCRPNAVIDCCGCSNTVNLGVNAVEQGGRLVLSGCQTECASLPLLLALAKQVSFATSFGSANLFPKALELINSNRTLVSKIITHRVELADAQRAFEFAADEECSNSIKVLIKWMKEEKDQKSKSIIKCPDDGKRKDVVIKLDQ